MGRRWLQGFINRIEACLSRVQGPPFYSPLFWKVPVFSLGPHIALCYLNQNRLVATWERLIFRYRLNYRKQQQGVFCSVRP